MVKGAMKGASFSSAKLGKPLVVEGVHVDGGALKLNLTVSWKGEGQGKGKWDKPLVVEGMHVDGGALKLNLTVG